MSLISWTVGDVTITRIPEMVVDTPLAGLLPDATPDAVAPHRSWLEPHFLRPDGTFGLSIHALVVDAGDMRILVDTCVGPHPIPGYPRLADNVADLPADMAGAGYPRESVDVVLCTHLHFDHVGWNTMRDGDRLVPTFPNARYLFARAEWEHWSTTPDTGTYAVTIEQAVRPIVDAGLATLVEPDHQLCDTVRLVPTAGHTPGHVSVEITSGGERALITGDMTHHPVQWAEPDWAMPADSDKPAAAATRRRIADMIADEQVLVIGTHYPVPCAGYLVRAERGVCFRA
jgi:glyoxylase-like metal-dependent hydrolase (beta-lactamase superfamily II)